MPDIMTKQLPVKLTNEEKIAKGLEQARLRDAIRAVKAEKKVAMTGFAERLAALEKDRDRVSDDIRDGIETRAVEVREERNYRLGTLRLVRVDTGEVVETRAMTAEEREEAQVTMFPGGGAQKLDPRNSNLRQAILDTLRANKGPMSKRAICQRVKGTHAVIRAIIDKLMEDGLLASAEGGGYVVQQQDASAGGAEITH